MDRQIRVGDSKYGTFDEEFLPPVPISPQILKFYITNNVFFLVHTPRSNRRTDSYAEWLKRRV